MVEGGGCDVAGQQVTGRDATAVVRHRIVSGTVRVGEPWTFDRLAEEVGTDPATAEAAVRELAREGFIDFEPDGFGVNDCACTGADDVLELRLLVEPVALRQAASLVRVADLIAMREVVEAIGDAGKRRDFDAYDEAVADLYATLLRLVPNRQLAELVHDLRARTRTEGVRQLVEAGLMAGTEWRYAKLLELVEARDLDAIEAMVAAGLRSIRFLGAARPGASASYPQTDEYPEDLVPFEVDDYLDTGW